jgi:glyoxylase-like metal-dependent hydrolase (beta-lactamase superfamily II)
MGVVRPSQTISGFEITPLTNGTFKENCYVVVHLASNDCLLIDPGAEAPFLQEHLDARGLAPQKIVLTHGHFDHVGAVDALMERFGIACEVHANEQRLVRQAATYAFRFSREPLRVPRRLTFFSTGSALDWNGRSIDVLEAPGHTAGSVALSLGGAFVFTGDALFHEKIGPTTYPESDPAAMQRSVANLLDSLPDDCVIFPGHGRPWSIGAARIWWNALRGPAPAQVIF